jgi:alkylated DNA repair dioxygenase AlkB
VELAPPHLDIEEDFVEAPGELMHALLEQLSWEGSMAARRTASCGVPYNYAQMVYPAVAFPPCLEVVRKKLVSRFDVPFNNCLLNHYPDGRSKMGFHSDDTSELVPESGVAIVSLGFPWPLRFRGRENPEERRAFPLASGSVLYMSAEVQQHWAHAIKRARYAEPRISLTWRAFVGD